MAVALRGNLRDFGIGEVFQLIGQQRKTGVLEIAGEDQRVQLTFDGGAIVAAAPVGAHADQALGEMLVRAGLLTRARLSELEREREDSLQTLPMLLARDRDLSVELIQEVEDLLTQETLFLVLRWRRGSFHFSSQPVQHDRDPSRLLGAEQVLMDGLRMVDEWQSFAARVPGESVFRRVGRFEKLTELFRPGSQRLRQAERILLLVDGRLPARRVVDLSRLGTFEGTRLLAELREAGLIEPRAVARSKRRAPVQTAPQGRLRLALGSLLPLLLLALVGLAPGWISGAIATPDGFRIERDPAAEARLAFATRRLRRAVEAYRFATGHWPRDLAELRDEGWVEASALTGPQGHPYYYVRHGDGFLLLAPES